MKARQDFHFKVQVRGQGAVVCLLRSRGLRKASVLTGDLQIC